MFNRSARPPPLYISPTPPLHLHYISRLLRSRDGLPVLALEVLLVRLVLLHLGWVADVGDFLPPLAADRVLLPCGHLDHLLRLGLG